ncbi:DUF2840 domain-containing protein [Enterobacter hormaechei]|uniref:DUF2840 domain-containing protein n=1 Tax=Enterobacter hormaechei TaxID=158836 RepID=UPI0018ED44B0|nr:DUF2840 domain-containing protein [Enterobacter hormaechei]MBJ6527252.1 DUF2840 domain-containing protein [Enterobacter hormaechei]
MNAFAWPAANAAPAAPLPALSALAGQAGNVPLTRVSLAYLEHRFKLYLRFGEPARTLQLDRWRRCAVFLPGARLLLHTEGDANVRAVLERIDGIEALGIAAIDVSPAYWRTLGNRLAARLALPEYTTERHTAWLAGKVLP